MVAICLMKRRKNYECQWTDPVTGKKKTATTGTAIRREAEQFRAKLALKLDRGDEFRPRKVTWKECAEEYRSTVLAHAGEEHRKHVESTINLIEEYIEPAWPQAIGAEEVSKFEAGLVKRSIGSATKLRHLAALRRILEWAQAKNYLLKVPVIALPEVAEKSKGRPLTDKEFRVLRDSAFTARRIVNPDSWAALLDGLWNSGLRLQEALSLDWSDDHDLCVDFSMRYPVFRIRVDADKGRRNRILPMAPEFSDFLQRIPKRQRIGKVFNPQTTSKNRPELRVVSRTISKIGQHAGIIVDGTTGDPKKFASAHDLRRSFGDRWSWRVVPRVLQVLMRHHSISTTMQYYAGRDAQEIAENVWAAFEALGDSNTAALAIANALANNGPKTGRTLRHSISRNSFRGK